MDKRSACGGDVHVQEPQGATDKPNSEAMMNRRQMFLSVSAVSALGQCSGNAFHVPVFAYSRYSSRAPFEDLNGSLCDLFHQGYPVERNAGGDFAPHKGQWYPCRVALPMAAAYCERGKSALARPEGPPLQQIRVHHFGDPLPGSSDGIKQIVYGLAGFKPLIL